MTSTVGCLSRDSRPVCSAVMLVACAFCAAVPLCGCRNVRSLVFTTGTTIGVEATAEEGPQQHMIIGLKRFEGAVVPTVSQGGKNVRKKAYSVFAALWFDTVLFGETKIVQVFGTGKAAETLAGSDAGLSNMVSISREMAGAELRGDQIRDPERRFLDAIDACRAAFEGIDSLDENQRMGAIAAVEDTLDRSGLTWQSAQDALQDFEPSPRNDQTYGEWAQKLGDLATRLERLAGS